MGLNYEVLTADYVEKAAKWLNQCQPGDYEIAVIARRNPKEFLMLVRHAIEVGMPWSISEDEKTITKHQP